jgi:hypothetical protein
MAYYNPAFTKYTLGVTDYERAVQQWNGNTLEYGTQAGGTGTLRPVKILGSALTTPDLISTGVVGATSGFTGPAGVVRINDVVALTPLGNPPSSPSEGWIYAGTDHHLYYYNGTAWKQLDN